MDKRSRVMDLLCLSAPFLIVWVVLSIIEWFGKQDLTILSILINIVVAPFTIIIVIIAKLGYFIATKLTSPGRTPSTEIEILPDPSEAAGNAQAMETPAPLASIEPARYPSGFDVEALLKYLPYILIGLVHQTLNTLRKEISYFITWNNNTYFFHILSIFTSS